MVYLFCKSVKETAKLDFEECIQTYFTENSDDSIDSKPKILFSFYYSHLDSNQRLESSLNTNANIPSNLHLVGASKAQLDFDFHVTQSEKIFRKICPTEEFMPKPPAQEDIIFDANDSSANSNEVIKDPNVDIDLKTNEATSQNEMETSLIKQNEDILDSEAKSDLLK